ncbi:hypothetical protein DdX_22415 [Ditylenchus destructor]|uniref:Uncharacterized protein n=1 Tax=Ditylenchus destructor TaxID=166010 RepID=A0AAD4MDL9_9BILA|nr:hypothetical protein DdX_22415 [Ditylenchus destructor]
MLTGRVCLDESMLKLLPQTKESFSGCKLEVHIFFPQAVPDAQNPVIYLMENVFCNPLSVFIDSCHKWLKNPSLVLQTKAVTNCNQLGLCWLPNNAECPISSLLDWLKNGNIHQNESRVAKKRLRLYCIPKEKV